MIPANLSPPRGLAPDRWALFLDIDGTLVDLADDPQAVRADSALLALLSEASALLDGALALVSGRDLADIDRIVAPLRLPAAGGHGAAFRPQGDAAAVSILAHGPAHHALTAPFADPPTHDGVRIERKAHSTAFHYRGRPDARPAALALAERLLAKLGDGWRLLPGKDVFETLPTCADKGVAVARFLESSPFAGRRPIFIGDDVTDEGGFAAVNARDGLSIRIGPPNADSRAAFRLDSPQALRRWLANAWAASSPCHNDKNGGGHEHA